MFVAALLLLLTVTLAQNRTESGVTLAQNHTKSGGTQTQNGTESGVTLAQNHTKSGGTQTQNGTESDVTLAQNHTQSGGSQTQNRTKSGANCVFQWLKLAVLFGKMDSTKYDKRISRNEFGKGMQKGMIYGPKDDKSVSNMFNHFDGDSNDKISLGEFLRRLLPPECVDLA